MSLADLSSREAVLEAMREYDELGRDAFLQKYGFEAARRYFVEHDGKRYESKAIAGVAVGKQHPDRGPLKSNEFTGGVGSVGRKMDQLGFHLIDLLGESDDERETFAELILEAMRLFKEVRTTPFRKTSALWTAMNAVADRLQRFDAVRKRPHIRVDWSLGKGVWLRTPWVALMDDRVTTSAQAGMYVVLLISEDLARLYITLNQGAAKLEKDHGRPGARDILRDRAARYRDQVAALADDGFTLGNDVDLNMSQYPSKYYEIGTIAYAKYDFPDLPLDGDLERLLEPLLEAYEALIVQQPPDPAASSETHMVDSPKAGPTNLILYGPPGTGKTYQTASEAVRLCDGALPAGGRDAIMKRYNELKTGGRIQFVTFHQSYGYEDFVEGLRPQTEADEDDEENVSGGFRLKPEPGIFKLIAGLAEQSGAAAPSSGGFDFSRRQFFKMSLGRSSDQSDIYQAAIEGGYVVLGWGGEHDWSDPAYDSWQAVLDKWRETEPDISPNRGDVVQTYHLRSTMKRGDIIIVSDGNRKFRAIGEVTGDYQYVPDVDEFRHRREVAWLRVFDKSLPVDLILDGNFTMMSLYRLNPAKVKVAALQNLIGGGGEVGEAAGDPESYVIIIDEINRANISKVFGELITLIEPDKRLGCENALTVTLPYSKEDFGIPANLHILGTMNTADRSIALLDTALRRRFRFQELMPDPSTLDDASAASGINLVAVLTNLNERIEYLFDREHQVGHAYFMACRERSDVDEVFRDKIIPLLSEYFYESWEKVWQALGEPEGTTDGGFLTRRKLSPPKGATPDTYGNDRWRYEIRQEFAANAYEQLM